MRNSFIETTTALLDEDPRVAVVLADISSAAFDDVRSERLVNVGIREQLMVGVAGGLALAGLRPIVHTYAPFLVERAFEQVKLDFGHQGVTGVLVSVGASYDWTEGGYTHMSPRDVALLDTMPGWRVHVPGHGDEVDGLLRSAVAGDEQVYIRLSTRTNREAHAPELHKVRGDDGPLVLAVGPALDNVLAATEGLDVTVAYTATPRPLDVAGLRALVTTPELVVVEPYLAGTSAHLVYDALNDRPRRLLSLGVGREELRVYGTPADHDRLHGLDPAGLRASITGFLGD
ncbi:transketolase [Longispora fulva]|uniref:Transketolase n=1 Tax=Longispora fulva TaxID=619741 RepID=A0A8J7GW56_9ACTN|nr:transketolase [Longispora fulva]MBG6139784.1 transketolase [Longispora fulva]GIG57832.1 transketolase [Longispora fulva]